MTTLADRQQYQETERSWLLSLDPDDDEGPPTIVALAESVCRACGCSDSLACPEGCGWAVTDGYLLCTVCDVELPADSPFRKPYPAEIQLLPDSDLREVLDGHGRGWTLAARPGGGYLVTWPHQPGLSVTWVMA